MTLRLKPLMRPVDPGEALLRRDPAIAQHLRRANLCAVPTAAFVVVQGLALAALVVALAQDGRFDARWAVLLLAAATGRAVLGWWLERSGRSAAAEAIGRLRDGLVRDAATLAATAPGTLRAGEVAADVVQGLPSIESFVGRFLSARPATGAITVGVLATIFMVDPLSALVLAPTVPLLIVFLWLVGSEAGAAADARLQSLQLFGAHLLDVLRGMADLRAHGRAGYQRSQVRKAAELYRVQTMATLRAAFLSGLVLELVAMLGTALVAVIGGVRLAQGNAELALILPALVLAPELYGPLRRLGAGYHEAADARAALGRLAAVQVAADAAPVPGLVGGPAAPTVVGAPIVLDGVSVAGGAVLVGGSLAAARASTGPRRERPEGDPGQGAERSERLRGVSLTLEPGRTTALVGPSGAGKSTLALVVLGLLRPSAGSVRCGDVDLSGVDLAGWRRRCAWVAQDPVLLPATLRDNARSGAPGADDEARSRALGADDDARSGALGAGDDAVLAALEAAGLGQLVADLPDGPETRLGDGGALLSSGELRRLALARVLLADADLVVLDEPTAQLDALTAERLMATIRELCVGRTTLLITHDPSIASSADTIVTLDAGRIVRIEPGAARAGHWSCTAPENGALHDQRVAGADAAGHWSCTVPKIGALHDQRVAGADAAGHWSCTVPKIGALHDQRVAGADAAGHWSCTAPENGALHDQRVGGEGSVNRPAAPRMRLRTALRLVAPPRHDSARGLARRAVVLGALSAVAAVAVLALSGGLIVKAADQPPVLELTIVIVLVRMFSIMRSAGRYGERLASHDAALRALERVRIQVFAYVARRDPDAAGLTNAGALDRAAADVDRAADLLIRVLVPGVSVIVAVTAAVLVGAIVSPLAAGVIALSCLVLGVGVARVALVAGRHQADAYAVRGDLMGGVITALDAGTEFLLAGRTDEQRRSIGVVAARLQQADARHGTRAGALAGVIAVGAAALVVILAAVLAPQVDAGTLSGPLAAALVLGGLATAERLDGLSEAALALPGAAAAVARLAPALLEVDDDQDAVDAGQARGPAAHSAAEGADARFSDTDAADPWHGVTDHVLTAEHLDLDRGGRPILRDVALELGAGERVAITGESGSGKSSLLLVLAGLLEPSAGEVLVRGGAMERSNHGRERRSADVVLVPSAPHLFGGTIAANLRLASPDATDDELHRALRAVGLGAWVDALPDGLGTLLGDGGVTASGGQRQRLGLARAYLSPARVLLLDEPASHLPEADALAALRAVLGARHGRAALVVSHRASERRLAHREVRLGAGHLGAPRSSHRRQTVSVGLPTP